MTDSSALDRHDCELIRELHASGMSAFEIAEKFLVPLRTVRAVISPNGRRLHGVVGFETQSGRIYRVLQRANRPMAVREIATYVPSIGHKSLSNRVSEMAAGRWPGHEIERVGKGVYRVAQ